MKNIDNITTKEEAHCFLTKEFADITHLFTHKKPGLSKKIDSYMINQEALQKKFEIDDLYTNALKGLLEIKSRQQDQDINHYKEKVKELREQVLDKKY